MTNTLLVNWVYYRPVGHALEGLKVARDYFEADRELKISVLLNSEMPYEIGALCPWIEKVYIADVKELAECGLRAKCLEKIPANWDYVVSDDRLMHSIGSYSDELKLANQTIIKYLQAKKWKGNRFFPQHENMPPIRFDTEMRFDVPESAKEFITKYRHNGLKICILPAGSNADRIYPEVRWWIKMMKSVTESFPDVRFYLTGAKSKTGNKSESYTFLGEDISLILSEIDNVENCFDIGIVNQIALLEYCDLLISPHSGFAFLASCVNTPWLSISGARWPEYFYNHIKFYSVLPSCIKYPCYTGMKEECVTEMENGNPVICMSTNELDKKIPQIIGGIKLLADDNFTYQDSIELYRKNVLKSGYPLENFWTFDGSFSISKG
jgi:ADP-heptose:LPS heptosyltransferase